MEPYGAANQAVILDPSILSRKPSPTRVYLFHLAPPFVGTRRRAR